MLRFVLSCSWFADISSILGQITKRNEDNLINVLTCWFDMFLMSMIKVYLGFLRLIQNRNFSLLTDLDY